MKRQLAAANRPPRQPSGGGKAKAKKGKGRGKKGGAAAAAAEEEEKEQEGGEEQEEAAAAAADAAAPADADMADADGAAAADEAAAGSDVTDTQLGSDTDVSRKQQSAGQKGAGAAGSSKGRKRPAAACDADGEAAGWAGSYTAFGAVWVAGTGGRKQRVSAACAPSIHCCCLGMMVGACLHGQLASVVLDISQLLWAKLTPWHVCIRVRAAGAKPKKRMAAQ